MSVVVNTEKPWTNYAKLWHIERKEKYDDVKFTTSEKNQEGEWENSNWLGRFIGEAKKKAKNLEGKERVILTKFKIKNVYNKETEKSYINFAIFDFDLVEEEPKSGKSSSSKSSKKHEDDDDEKMPWDD